jgi:hypothetical protein
MALRSYPNGIHSRVLTDWKWSHVSPSVSEQTGSAVAAASNEHDT